MTDYTTDVTVTIHGTEIELTVMGGEIFPAEPDIGIMSRYIDGHDLHFADGTRIPSDLAGRISREEWDKIGETLDEALARGDFDPDPDR